MKKSKAKQAAPIQRFSWQKVARLLYIALPAFAFLLYSNTNRFGYNGDDDAVTRGNRHVQQGVKGIGEIFTTGYYDGFAHSDRSSNDRLYRPLPLASFAIEKQLWGNSPETGHLINVILYSAACLLLYMLLIKLLSPAPAIISICITLLFIAHPVHTEVVANIKSRDEILCLFFLLLSLITLVNYARAYHFAWLAAMVLSLALSLLSKENAIAFLGLAPLTIFFTQKHFNKKVWLSAMPAIAAVAAAYLFARSFALGEIANRELDIMDNSLVAANSASEIFATNFVILWKYLQLLFVPTMLSWDYSYNQIPIANWSSPVAWLSLLIHGGLLTYALFNIKNKSWIAYGIFFYFIALSISSNFIIKIASTMAERFLFIPSIGFCIAAVLVAEKMIRKIPCPALKTALSLILISCVAAGFSYKTVTQNKVWSSPLSLMEHGAKASPNSARAHLFLGHEYMDMAAKNSSELKKVMDVKKAIGAYKKSLEIYPEYGGALNSIGRAYFFLGDMDSAIYFFRKVSATDKEFVKAGYNLGDAWFSKGQSDSALHYFRRVTPDDAAYGLACNSIGFIYAQMNLADEALASMKIVPPGDPAFGKACNNIGKIYLNQELPDSAMKYFLSVPEDDDAFGNARNNAGNIYFEMNDMENALSMFEKVKPKHGMDYRDALFFSGRVYFAQGNDKAIVCFQNAIVVDPKFTPAYEALSRIQGAK